MTKSLRWPSVLQAEYVLRPLQYGRRLYAGLNWPRGLSATVRLPWGMRVNVNPTEDIGRAVVRRGLYETEVVELLWRLTLPEDTVIDAGANIGYMSSVFAARLGPGGKLFSFEPHPEIFARLEANAGLWRNDGAECQMRLRRVALGSARGAAILQVPEFFANNQGTAFIGTSKAISPSNGEMSVEVASLADEFGPQADIGVVKLDVEGHELEVLKGMRPLLEARRVRDIVFEEHGEFPAPTHKYLKSFGYSIFGVARRWWGLVCKPEEAPNRSRAASPNYLATREPQSVRQRLEHGAWRSFGILAFFNE
jgi:FkbM family methyltransferase